MRYAVMFAVVGCGTDHTRVPLDDCAAIDSIVQLGALTNAMTAMDAAAGLTAATTMLEDDQYIFASMTYCAQPGQSGTSVSSCSPLGCTFSAGFEMYPAVYSFDGTVMRDGDVLTLTLHSFL